MAFEMKQTSLEGFPIQYGPEVVKQLNEIYALREYSRGQIGELGKAVSPYVEHSMDISTKDGYEWFGRLDYSVEKGRVAILFPWSQDWEHSETQADRSINVYSDKELNIESVFYLLENVSYQMALIAPEQRRDLNRNITLR